METTEEKLQALSENLKNLGLRWRQTPAKEKKERRRIRKKINTVLSEMEYRGFGGVVLKKNILPENRDIFSIWHIRNQRVEIPPGLSVRQATDLMSNGHCGD